MIKSLIATNDNITIVTDKERLVINRLKNEKTFKEVLEKAEQGDVAWIEGNISRIKDEIENKTDGVFSVSNGGNVMLKGTNVVVPEPIVKKLLELQKEEKPILPLLRFWRKLMQNPSENSRNELFTFMTKNNIPITEQGDIVTEKGVKQRLNSFPGDLVDERTGTIDNSIGSYVTMEREKVDDNRNRTCSAGLHVAAPDYVRNIYSGSIIVECIVNPKDVVSVPIDYNATKMRVCAYHVAGYARKESRKSLEVVKLSDFFTMPTEEQASQMGGAPKKKLAKKVKIKNESVGLEGKSAKQIVDFVKEKTGEVITISLKSKKSIQRKAEQILLAHGLK